MWPDSLLRDLEPVDSRTDDLENATRRTTVHTRRRNRYSNDTNMRLRVRSINDSHGLAYSTKGEVSWSTTEEPFTPEEEDAIVTLVVVVIGIVVAIVILFSMGIFIDCKHQKQDALQKKKKLKLRMPPLSRAKRSEKEDAKSLASDMCPNGSSDAGFRTRDAVV
ncbi:uncharacterized protein LOC143153397 [Ptiloglossa arizonensis]|uniref:uncharacterized protein LOC143153397 n=1 Tax=Ptiloglossa arizonensis TaxID=3350558 RepID=UPI003FA06B04